MKSIISFITLVALLCFGFTTHKNTDHLDSGYHFVSNGLNNDLNQLWEPGQEIWIKFIGGTAFQHRQVKKYAAHWQEHVSLKFRFGHYTWAHVRISFNQYDGHWSYIGRESTRNQGSPSMNIALNNNDSMTRWSRVVLHEFGHMLGLVHEHSNPCANPITFKEEKEVIEYYKRTQGWTKEQIIRNVLTKQYDATYCTPFDPESIMLYNIPSNLLIDEIHLIENTKLSIGNKAFVKFLYP
ncbi:MAG: M12 family metallopeptidase [Bacteroidota bacterium]